MTLQALPLAHTYDDFAGPALDITKWRSLSVPLPDGSLREAAERSAVTVVEGGQLAITVDEFEYSHDTVQAVDNLKHMLISTREFTLPAQGTATFSINQSASLLGRASSRDSLLGVAAFNVIDLEQGLVFDVLSNGAEVFAVHEQLAYAPRPAGPAYTHVASAPFAPVVVEPGVPQLCAIVFDSTHRTVRWLVNDVEIYRVQGVPWPERVVLALALMTGVRLREGRSRSLQGQGLQATWSSPSAQMGDR